MKRTGRNNPALNPTKVPTAIDIAWAAGIYEGEGHCRSGSHSFYGIMANVVQKDPELLYRLRDLFGGNVRFARCRTIPSQHQTYTWEVCGDRARLFLAMVYPFLTARRKGQVDAIPALEFLSGSSPLGVTLEQLHSDLLRYHQEHAEEMKRRKLSRDNTWTPHRSGVRKKLNQSKREAELLKIVPINSEKVS